jgi:hypothetical protein
MFKSKQSTLQVLGKEPREKDLATSSEEGKPYIPSSLKPCTPLFAPLMMGAYVRIPCQPHGLQLRPILSCAPLCTHPSLGAHTYAPLGRARIPSLLAVYAPSTLHAPYAIRALPRHARPRCCARSMLRCTPPLPCTPSVTACIHVPVYAPFAVCAPLWHARPSHLCVPLPCVPLEYKVHKVVVHSIT